MLPHITAKEEKKEQEEETAWTAVNARRPAHPRPEPFSKEEVGAHGCMGFVRVCRTASTELSDAGSNPPYGPSPQTLHPPVCLPPHNPKKARERWRQFINDKINLADNGVTVPLQDVDAMFDLGSVGALFRGGTFVLIFLGALFRGGTFLSRFNPGEGQKLSKALSQETVWGAFRLVEKIEKDKGIGEESAVFLAAVCSRSGR